MRRSRQRCSDSQCFFSILPLAAALKLPEGDKGQCGTCFGWWGDDAVPSKTGRASQLLGSICIYTCTCRSPYRQGLKSSGCHRFMSSTVTPQRGQRPILQHPTHLLHILCALLGRFTSCIYTHVWGSVTCFAVGQEVGPTLTQSTQFSAA